MGTVVSLVVYLHDLRKHKESKIVSREDIFEPRETGVTYRSPCALSLANCDTKSALLAKVK